MTKQTPSTPVRQYIDDVARSNRGVSIYLLNGVKLEGKVVGHDDDGLILQREGKRQVVWYHAMSSLTAE